MSVIPDYLQAVSVDARSVGFAFFPTEGSRVTFHMETKGPSPRCQAALDELVSADLVTKVVHSKKTGAATYRPTRDFGPLAAWQAKRLFSGEMERDPIVLWQPLEPSP